MKPGQGFRIPAAAPPDSGASCPSDATACAEIVPLSDSERLKNRSNALV